MQLSVIIPVYNERRWIAEVLARVLAVDVDKQVVVDDGSTDGTAEWLAEWQAGQPEWIKKMRALSLVSMARTLVRLWFAKHSG